LKTVYRRGEIWWIRLDPTIGVEARALDSRSTWGDPKTALSRKTRACLILQNDAGNRASNITTIAPFLARKNYAFVVNVHPAPINGLDRERGLHLNQIRSVDRSRIVSRIGEIEDAYWSKIENAIAIQLGFFSSTRS
jgi:mRNA interferase MazF